MTDAADDAEQEDLELIETRVAPPVWMGSQILRDALARRLDAALDHRLTIVHAPAGYGKTSLLSQWRQHAAGNATIAWLTLDGDARDPRMLCGYIAMALDGCGAKENRAGVNVPPKAALTALIARLAKEEGTVVVILDDWHRAEGPVASDLVATLLRLAPANCRFVVATREYPRLGQSILAAECQLLQFGMADLRFSPQEARALLSRNAGEFLDDEVADTVIARTDGWPIALQLTALSLRQGSSRENFTPQALDSGGNLSQYLSEHVLGLLSEEMQEVVLRCSILDDLTGPLVDLLCEREDGWLVLDRLERLGIFLTADTPDRSRYHFHQLFAEHMRERLVRRQASLARSLHARLAAHHSDAGDHAFAIHHAVESGELAAVAGAVAAAGGWRMIPHGHQPALERALDALPLETTAAEPVLALANVYLTMKHGDLAMARALYDRLISESGDGTGSHGLRMEIRVVGDTLADYENRPVTLPDLIERETLLRTLPADDHLVLANFSETLAAKYYEGGWLERAMEPVQRARENYRALGSLYSEMFTRFLEARIRQAQGRIEDAAAILEETETQIHASFGERSDLAANCAAFRADVLLEQGEGDESLELLEWALPHMEGSDGWVDVYHAAYATRAQIAADRGNIEEALGWLDRARRLARRRGLRQLELLAEYRRLLLLIAAGRPQGELEEVAERLDLDAHAGSMAEESPLYRPVAIAAALCRAKLRLTRGDHAGAIEDLEPLRSWSDRRGAGRLSVEVRALLAHAHRIGGELSSAREMFDDCVSMAIFQRLVRPFADNARFCATLLSDAAERTASSDRFRHRFLKEVSTSLNAQRNSNASHGPFTHAELEVLGHLASGLANKEIARLIDKSPDTVKYRLKAIFRKLGVSKRRDAVRLAQQKGFVGPQAG